MNKEHNGRDHIGYGSTYQRGTGDKPTPDAIKTVLNGQVWLVKPDQKIKSVHPCVWMQAGAVKFKNCTNFYDCITCTYDHAMGEKVKSGKQISWQDIMRLKPEMKRVCRHSLVQRIPARTCAYNYECAACDFDQFFEDVWSVKTADAPHEIQLVRGFKVPMGYYFHEGHTWARIESGGTIRIGMDDFIMKSLGNKCTFVLPLMGKRVIAGMPSWKVISQENSTDVLSPVSGIIIAVNQEATPAIVSEDPYGKGWLFLVNVSDIKNVLKPLMTDQQAMNWISGE